MSMRDKDRELARLCQKWGQSVRNAEKWLNDNRDSVGGECDLLCKNMRAQARMYNRLATAALRKMCVGVFGPSQAGKSYLISVLAKDREGNLVADFMGKRIDFIEEINPQGGKESTGLVTRFTTTPPEGTTPDKPVRLRLFSEMDLVRVFANTYYADCDHKKPPVLEDIVSALKALEKRASDKPVCGITADDVEDLREYLQKNFASRPRLQTLSLVYWTRAMELAPRLALVDRKELFGLIWENIPEFDSYFYTLAKALENLGSPAEVNCPLEALLPRSKSIIDVALLAPDAPGADEELEISTLDGKSLNLPRRLVTALTAELTIYMPNEPDAFFAHTDLLDFPGYRSRLKTNDLREALTSPGALEKTFFLRGKVAYLFERYCDEQELTSMLLCIGPSNQEVQDLPGAINNWICLTQGETPQSRKGHAPTLFFILTKVDMEFARKRGTESGDSDNVNSWDIRLASSLTNFFGAQYDWPANWDGKPFRNVFLLRNPNFLCDAVFTFDKDGRETAIRPDMRETVEKVHSDFLHSELVRDHFEDPEESWQAAIKLNDGGIELLRKKLAPICDPDRKYNQTRDRAFEICAKIVARLEPYYRADDMDERKKQKEKLAKELLTTLAGVVSRQQFADFLSRFLVSDYDLYKMASECAEIPEADDQGSTPQQTVVGTAMDADDILGSLFGPGPDLGANAPANEGTGKESVREEKADTDQVSVFCRRAVNHWFETVRAQAELPYLPRIYHVTPDFLDAFAQELILGARHARLLDEMREAVRKISSFRNITREVAAWRMASEAAYRINSFVSWLGHDARIGQKTAIVYNGTMQELFPPARLEFGPHGEPIVPAQQQQYDRSYSMSWLMAFFDSVTASLNEHGEDFDPVQNKRLGAIIASLKL